MVPRENDLSTILASGLNLLNNQYYDARLGERVEGLCPEEDK
jgi:hypothetical protein